MKMKPEEEMIDALLREHARLSEPVDSSFVASVEKSLDACGLSEGEEIHPPIVAGWRRWRLAAAVVLLLTGVGYFTQRHDRGENLALEDRYQAPVVGASVVGHRSPGTDDMPAQESGQPDAVGRLVAQSSPQESMETAGAEQLNLPRKGAADKSFSAQAEVSRMASPQARGVERMGVMSAPSRNRSKVLGGGRFVLPRRVPASSFALFVSEADREAGLRWVRSAQQRRSLGADKPPALLNAFDYICPVEGREHPVGLRMELATCPWNRAHRLLMVVVRGEENVQAPGHAALARGARIKMSFNPERVAQYRMIRSAGVRGGERPDGTRSSQAVPVVDGADTAAGSGGGDPFAAGELAAGRSVVALYEIVPKPAMAGAPKLSNAHLEKSSAAWVTARLSYQPMGEDASERVLTEALGSGGRGVSADWRQASADFKFAAGVAWFGLLHGQGSGQAAVDWAQVRRLCQEGLGEDPRGDRAAFSALLPDAGSKR